MLTDIETVTAIHSKALHAVWEARQAVGAQSPFVYLAVTDPASEHYCPAVVLAVMDEHFAHVALLVAQGEAAPLGELEYQRGALEALLRAHPSPARLLKEIERND